MEAATTALLISDVAEKLLHRPALKASGEISDETPADVPGGARGMLLAALRAARGGTHRRAG